MEEKAFNKALNAADVRVKDWNGGLIRRATAEFRVRGIKGSVEVSVAITPAAFRTFGYTPGVDVMITHCNSASSGTVIHWDAFGIKHVDSGFTIDRLPELIRLATPTSSEVQSTLKEAAVAFGEYSGEMGIGG